MKRPLIFFIFASFVVSTSGSAQRANELQKGVRVRVTRTHGRSVVGTYAGAEMDSVRVLEGGPRHLEQRLAASDVSKIEVSNGRNRAMGALIKGAIGLGVGAAAGAVLGAISYSNQADTCPAGGGLDCGWGCFFVCSRGQAAGLVGALGGAAGLVVGGFYGLATGQESWTTVTAPSGR